MIFKTVHRVILYVLIILLVLFYSPKVIAQTGINSIKWHSSHLPESGYRPPMDSIAKSGNTSHSSHFLQIDFSLYQVIDTATGKIKLLSGSLKSMYSKFENRDYEKTLFPDELLAADISMQYYTTLHNSWSLVAFIAGGLYSDLERVNNKDVFVNGGLIFIKTFTPKLALGFGAIVNNNFGAPLVWPALTVRWQPGTRYKLDVLVPDNGIGLAYNISFGYQLSKNKMIAFVFRPKQLSYDVEHVSSSHRLMSYWELPLGFEYRQRQRKIEFIAGAGLMALRSAQYSEKKLSKIFSKYPAHMLAAQLYVSAGVKVNFR